MEEIKTMKRDEGVWEAKRAKKSRNLKICLACSIGGHFTEMLELKEVYEKYDYFFVTNPGAQIIYALANERKYFVPVRVKKSIFLKQLFMSLKILLKEMPDVIITTGSGDMFWICVLAKLFRKKVIYIESFARVTNPSKFGKFVYKFADLFIYQWEKLKKQYPKGIYGGIIFNLYKFENKDDNIAYSYFVTAGTTSYDSSRLLKKIDELVEQEVITGKVFAQVGHSKYLPKNYEWSRFFSVEKYEDIIRKSKLIITYDGAGSISRALKYKKPIIIIPRLKRYAEIGYDNKFELAKELNERFDIPVVEEINDVEEALENVNSLRYLSLLTNEKMIGIIEQELMKWMKDLKIRADTDEKY